MAQFFISTEMFAALTVLLMAAVVLFAFAVVRGLIGVDWPRLIRVLAAAAAVVVVGMGYAAWIALAGPEHIVGPAQTATALAGLTTDPVGLIVPTILDHFTLGHAALGDTLVASRSANWTIGFDAPAENGSYVGIPLLLLLVGGVVALRRHRVVVVSAVLAVVGFVLSMGSHLHFDGHRTSIPLPYVVLDHLPLLKSGVPSRYVLFFWLFAALIFAVSLGAIHAALARRGDTRSQVRALAGSGMVAVVALVWLAPAWPYASAPAAVPTWFTTSAGAGALPAGSTVVVYPFASPTDASAMVWQAMADFRFRMPGGYAVFASPPSGAASFASDASPLQGALAVCAAGQTASLPAADVTAQLRAWHARRVVVAASAEGAGCATAMLQAALGAPAQTGGVLVWVPSGR